MESNRQFFDQSLLEKLRQISQQFEQYKMVVNSFGFDKSQYLILECQAA